MGIQPEDLSRLAEIECLCNLTDPLAQYMAMDIRKNWTAHIDASAQFLAKKILEPGCVCWVMTIDSSTARHSNGEEVAAWAIWTRHGIGRPSSNEHRHPSSFAEDLEDRCPATVDETIFDQASIARIKHIIHKPTVPIGAGLVDFWELDGMYVDPKSQRQGLGQELLQWGIEKARIENIPIVTKSSPVGIYLYERNDFRSFRKEDFEPFFEVGDRGMHLMIWEPSVNGYWLVLLRSKS